MNPNEFFYFKTEQCQIFDDNHNKENCYFHHRTDERKPLFNIAKTQADANLELYNNIRQYCPKKEFKSFFGHTGCRNLTEVEYHILNYKTKKCHFEENNQSCLFTFCPDIHRIENQQETLLILKKFYQEALEKHVSVSKTKIIKVMLESFKNSYKSNTLPSREVLPVNNERINSLVTLNKEIMNNQHSELQKSKVEYKVIGKYNIKAGDKVKKLIKVKDNIVFARDSLQSQEVRNYMKIIAAMINAEGGLLIFGVDNELTVKGYEFSRQESDKVKNNLNIYMVGY